MKRVLFAMALCLLAVTTTAQAETITVCSYGGTYNKALEEAFAKPFTAETGIEVVFVSFPNYAKMKAQVQSGNVEWDVVEPSINGYVLGAHDGLFEPLDLSGIPVDDFVKGGIQPYGVSTVYYSHNVAYRTDVWPAGQGPKTWADVWNTKKFPGPRAVKYTAYSNLEAALLADGVPPSEIYPIDVDRAFKKLDELKPHIKVYWKNGAHAQQVMRAHEADTGSFAAGRMLDLAKDGVPVVPEWNGAVVDLDYLVILKGCKHKDAAMKFIKYTTDPKRQAKLAMASYYGPSNLKAYDYIPEDMARQMPSHPDNMKNAVIIDGEWYREHGKEVTARWEAWKMQ
ncbi:ABC transporter substrate-binding protein [Desulfovibrio ferrophilus]|uniref:Extracellular solute-binding protein family 1 n=1 Tax=Desulfovibrio ferrophilus TaxID=241368 RepID=A0A2Z6B1A4_9BACT|nr:ABC transporter substrate-binding protein [Desulfovibrio ferrophilus]BBD09245.1 extracellular solute-binding protein family 1 [Desulfovibrio ferrophilus]